MSLLKGDGINFNISAPGRIVLSGDIGAMFGKYVVLASVNLRTSLDFSELPVDAGMIIIDFPKVNLMSLTISMKEIVNFRSSEHFTTLISDHLRFRNILKSFITRNGMWKTFDQRCSLLMFFFLLMHIATYEELNIKPFRVHVSTESYNVESVGSSSAFAVCLSACFIHWACLQRDTNYQLNEEKLNCIIKYAKLAEKIAQTEVFETDIDVCCYGKVIKFKYDTERYEYSIDKIDAPMLSIMLVDLNNEVVLGERIMQLKDKNITHNEHMKTFTCESDECSTEICQVLKNMDVCFRNGNELGVKDGFEELKKLFEKYQLILSSLELIDDNLGLMCSIAKSVDNCTGMIASYENNPAYVLLLPTMTLEQIYILHDSLGNQGFIVNCENNASSEGLTINNHTCALETLI